MSTHKKVMLVLTLVLLSVFLGVNLSFAGDHGHGFGRYGGRLERADKLETRAASIIKTNPEKAQRLTERALNLRNKANNMLPTGFGIQRYDKLLNRSDVLANRANDIVAKNPTKAERLNHRADNLLVRAVDLGDKNFDKMGRIYQTRINKANVLVDRANDIAAKNPTKAEKLNHRIQRLIAEANWIKTGVESVFK